MPKIYMVGRLVEDKLKGLCHTARKTGRKPDNRARSSVSVDALAPK